MKTKIDIEIPTGISSTDVWYKLGGLSRIGELVLSESVHLAFYGWDVIFPKGADINDVIAVLIGIPNNCHSILPSKVISFVSKLNKEEKQ